MLPAASSHTSVLHRLFAALALFCLVPARPASAQSGDWEVVKISGRDYVSIDSVKRFYDFTKLTRNGESITLENPKVEMKLRVGSQECLMNSVKFVFSYNVEAEGSKAYISRIDLAKLVDPVLRPSYIANAGAFRTVIIDPGHGGKDPGATNAIGTEANYTLRVCTRLKQLLETKGFHVVMTRSTDNYLTLQERVDIANRINDNALFISIHFNSGGSAARGIETFTLSPQGVAHYGRGLLTKDFEAHSGNEHDSANIALATAVHGSVIRRLGEKNTFDRGIKRARYSVLSGVKHPAILLEGGFVTHPYEARLIENEQYQAAIAAGVADAVVKYQFAVTRRPAPVAAP